MMSRMVSRTACASPVLVRLSELIPLVSTSEGTCVRYGTGRKPREGGWPSLLYVVLWFVVIDARSTHFHVNQVKRRAQDIIKHH